MSEHVIRRWIFSVEDEAGETRRLGSAGEPDDAAAEWIGADEEAENEAKRRADAWEAWPGNSWALKVIRESRGKVAIKKNERD